MRINGVGPGSVAGRTESTPPSADEADGFADEIRVGAVDRAEISSEGLSRAREAQGAQAAEVGLDMAHFELIQTRIDSGFYKQPEVIDEIARRMVTAGDL
jgi:hypothetical protein